MGVLGWIMATVLVALMLPLLAFLYLDILEAKHETKVQLEQVQKLKREVEKQQRDNRKPNEFSENPVFDRRSKREHF